MGCDGQVNNNCLVSGVFQSTHPSGVRHPCPSISRSTPSISIHAPQWGATELVSVRDGLAGISIHAPQWGATVLLTVPVTVWVFQSTHPSGVRPLSNVCAAPTTRFQSTHPSGVRQYDSNGVSRKSLFQSTHPSGVRLSHATPERVR